MRFRTSFVILVGIMIGPTPALHPLFARFFTTHPRRPKPVTATRRRTHYLEHKEAARRLITERLRVWNAHYGFSFGRVAIRDQRSRWGSCSKKGNLNFNYRLLFLPLPLVDLVIVHELCHLKEFNHSSAFWALVEQTIPDLALRRNALRHHAVHSVALPVYRTQP